MLTQVRLSNFRSIRNSEVRLGELTVVVGANGAGKSNFVKALKFISRIASVGLDETLATTFPLSWVFPKYVDDNHVENTRISIEYTVDLGLPSDLTYPGVGTPSVQHYLTLLPQPVGKGGLTYIVENESIIFNEPFTFLDVRNGKGIDLPPIPQSVVIARDRLGKIRVEFKPELRAKDVDAYVDWFGLDFLSSILKPSVGSEQPEWFLNFLQTSLLFERDQVTPGFGRKSLLDPELRTLLAFNPQMTEFRKALANLEVYDFSLDVLRREQDLNDSTQITSEGSNIAAVLRQFKPSSPAYADGNDQHRSWNRLLEAMIEIAPHLDEIKIGTTLATKEYIQFIESHLSKPVESWNTSDGTLRALAIMLAMETHPVGGTLIIEEPEQNLHPWAIKTILDYARFVIESRKVQIVFTTHSQHVLEALDPSEVLLVNRHLERGTVFNRLREMRPGHQIEMGEIGRLWVKGHLTAIPNYED